MIVETFKELAEKAPSATEKMQRIKEIMENPAPHTFEDFSILFRLSLSSRVMVFNNELPLSAAVFRTKIFQANHCSAGVEEDDYV